jgi:hypothetical protein
VALALPPLPEVPRADPISRTIRLADELAVRCRFSKRLVQSSIKARTRGRISIIVIDRCVTHQVVTTIDN